MKVFSVVKKSSTLAVAAIMLVMALLPGASGSASAQDIQTPSAPDVLTTQVGFILDSSGSIGSDNWDIIRTGLASALGIPLCVPDDGSVEFTLTTFSTSASVVVEPTVLTAASLPGVISTVENLTYLGNRTNISDGLMKTADAMSGSANFDAALKQAVNLVTDGEPNENITDPPCDGINNDRDNTVCWRNYLLDQLGMTGAPDELDSEFIGSQGDNSDWLRDEIVFPQPGSYASLPNTFVPGWVLVVPDAQSFADAVCQKFSVIVEPAGTVTKTPNPPILPEPGGPVTFTVLIENDIDQPIDVTALNDAPYGDVTVVAGLITATTCSVPQTLAASDGNPGSGPDTYTCTFTVNITGPAGPYPDTVTATIESQTGNTAQISGDATVLIQPPTSVEITGVSAESAGSAAGLHSLADLWQALVAWLTGR